MIVYGIKNCNTVKKALDWLQQNHVDYVFHDYKVEGITETKLKDWCRQVGWESLVNKKGTTWRQLDEALKETITTQSKAISLMKEKTSVIKRPLIEVDDTVLLLGFDEQAYNEKLAASR